MTLSSRIGALLAASALLSSLTLLATPRPAPGQMGEGGQLSVNGAVGIPLQDLTSSILSAVPIGGGRCELRLQLGVEGDGGIGFQVILPGGLAPGPYQVGPTSQDAGMWDDELAAPGVFTATAALDRAYDPPERRLFGFWSTEGTFRVEHFDGERLEASFSVELRERAHPSVTPPPYFIGIEGRVAQSVGRDVLAGIPTSGFGGFYLCDVGAAPMALTTTGPSDYAVNVDPEEPPIQLRFGIPIDPTTLHEGTFRLQYRLPDTGASEPRFAGVAGAWSPTDDGGFRFTPSAPLLDGVQYQAMVRGGPDGVRGTGGEQLDGNPSWHFTTLVEPRVRVTVDQGENDGPLEPGRSTRVRVYVDWNEKPDVHPTWQAPAFPARVEVRVNGSPVAAYPAREVPLTRPDHLRARDGDDAQLSVDFEGWVPTADGTFTVTATVEPLLQEVPVPRRFESPALEIRIGGGSS